MCSGSFSLKNLLALLQRRFNLVNDNSLGKSPLTKKAFLRHTHASSFFCPAAALIAPSTSYCMLCSAGWLFLFRVCLCRHLILEHMMRSSRVRRRFLQDVLLCTGSDELRSDLWRY